VIERAKTILSELERSDRESPKRTLVDDLPLFAAAPVRTPPAPAGEAKVDALREALAAIDPDAMAPREALEALYRLKAEAGRQ
jgi:DNA mismatch repair protein MutS